MQVTQRGGRFVVVDDFLDAATLAELHRLMERSTFSEVDSVLYPETDGKAFRSRGTYVRGGGQGEDGAAGRSKAFERILQQVVAEPGIFGTAGQDWDRAGFTFWRYPAGSRLSWHNDAGGGRTGEFIVFLHEEWRASWGGELMILDEEPVTSVRDGDFLAQMELQVRESASSPVAIVPRPNRLVLVKAGTVHQINRVDPTAAAPRRTLTGFISKQTAESGAQARDALLRLVDRSAGEGQ
ncbi:2OG-Fe(II) oxygenase [Kitasatospora sp. YST-16]|uniref:2OG-Fe(II) oxygenase n=1 Tax=Kitasatospora sp. YST-16 TaxID=2998080 RepID=UPI0022840EBB|nr:2OG-Fe(II) oxygenase [Kitasatospora sp. YST-16]WAL72912.1 2OG-Fe(II) oxygenase [Kitasatospora sp. YST-16]WNW38962.1 2OG-Fe(II) oxygenase [Streptomyces sp. Li-HN-5-13]